jgi:hypothetical protein
MDPSEVSPEYELTVRNHIRQTFLHYVRKHITRDHVAYTEFKLEQVRYNSFRPIIHNEG